MPYTNAHHGGGEREPLDLPTRIEAELRTRIEDAVDYACLDAMVKARQDRGAAAPAADNARDREEYDRRVADFLERVRAALVPALPAEQRQRLGNLNTPHGGDVNAALAIQVTLAKELPDYWQRFEDVRQQPSGGDERRGLLDRFLGR
ncbi:MAG: hypothetical protein HYU41_19760 [Candidatus Rokubacteria bacterium]|nr:hypothetical protein [Candidatus Rokubacteria bacterium]